MLVGPPKDLQEGCWVTAPPEAAESRYQGGRIRSNQVSISCVDIYGSECDPIIWCINTWFSKGSLVSRFVMIVATVEKNSMIEGAKKPISG